ncbi:MAG TPA: N-glycosylase/DNA lyase [Candidatus Syntrophoarchaeum butanivorans]|uniref:8-oxoguanine DNA glycosylase/AP lyase n=1 Tax=Candidatus Syntropharchaeum butanivorans TaxID=1839936 RepID=A0A7J2RZW8_9EURY|nr:N-glycosylase/DNA lyase [Candidatus Syntrophoarchaeum butanivorans]
MWPTSKKELILEIERLLDSPVRDKVRSRMLEFDLNHRMDTEWWFDELCFCLLTANANAARVLEIWRKMKIEGLFIAGSLGEVRDALKTLGYRFYNKRALYIIEARSHLTTLKHDVTSFDEPQDARDWLCGIKGIGMKEASHFLRNVGYRDLAILDRHILRLMDEHGLINGIRWGHGLSRRRYLDIESSFRGFSQEIGLPPGELDLYLWYIKTGCVVK